MGVALAAAAAAAVSERVLEEPVKGFQYAEVDQATGKRRSLFHGETAQNISNEELQVTGARLEIFTDDGRTNLIVGAPECVYNTRTRVVSSPAHLSVSTGEGRFSIEGKGFEWRPAEAHLVISNEVHAVIHKQQMDPTTLATQAEAVAMLSSNQLVHIYSSQFQFHTNIAVFRQNVRVDDPQGKLTCERLTATFTEPDRRIETVLAEENVVIGTGEIRATSERGTYQLAKNVVELSGNPTWAIDRPKSEGRAEEIIIDRVAKDFRASRNVRMTLPPGSIGRGGFLLPDISRTPVAAPVKSDPVQVSADDFHFKPDAVETNFNTTVFRGNVQINNGQGKLTCGRMTIRSYAEGGRAERVTAEDGFVAEQEGNRVNGQRAVYEEAKATVEITGNPTWKLEDQDGSAEVLVLDVEKRAYQARGKVQMRMPAGTIGRTAWLLPETKGATNVTIPEAKATELRPNGPVEFSSDEFEFKRASEAGGPDLATYRGNVVVSDPDRMKLSCGLLTGAIVAGTNQVQSILAERNVEIRILNPQGDRIARGDKAVYTAGREQVVLSGQQGAEIVLADAEGLTRAQGREIIYERGADLLQLVGDPQLTTAGGEVTGDTVILDRPRTTLKATGNWKMKLKPDALEKAVTTPPKK
jgi:lipopolysaccharide transport protein LptA